MALQGSARNQNHHVGPQWDSFSLFFESPPRRAGWGAGAGFVFQGPPWRARPTGVSRGASRGGQGPANGAKWEAREDEPPTVERNVEHYVAHDVEL